jgi:hypothetical protein
MVDMVSDTPAPTAAVMDTGEFWGGEIWAGANHLC